MASDEMLKQLQELAESAAGESTRLKDHLTSLDKLNMPDKKLLIERKARAIYLRLSAMPDFIEIVTRNKKWMGKWWRSPIRQAQGIAILVATWHPIYLVGFALAAVVMLVLSTASVRRALGQE